MTALHLKKLALNKSRSLHRTRRIKQSPTTIAVRCDEKTQISFCSNDYLGLANHPDVINAFKQGIDQYGVGSGASQIVSGHTQPHRILEETFAEFMGRERALFFSNGYMANLGILATLCTKEDCIYQDKLNHASLIDAAKLAAAPLKRFHHNDMAHLQKQLTDQNIAQKWIVSDGVFSTHGEIADLPELVNIAESQNAMLIIDDAHGIGILGAQGRGSIEHFKLETKNIAILVCPLGKAFGTYGALVSGSHDIIEYLIQFARPYLYTTAPPPALAVATLKSLHLLQTESWRREQLQYLIAYFKEQSRLRNLQLLPSQTAIQSFVFYNIEQAVFIYEKLFANGFWAGLLRPPTTKPKQAMLRVTLNVGHTTQQVDQLLDLITEFSNDEIDA